MGRTKRRRKKRIRRLENSLADWSDINELQKSLKVKCKFLKISHFDETGRGMRCRKTLKEGDVLISLPLDVLITPDKPHRVLSLIKTWENQSQLDLSVLLIYEKHLENLSKYNEYLKTLPTSYTNLYFSTDGEIELLPNFMQKLVRAQKEIISKTYENLIKTLEGLICSHCGTTYASIYSRKAFDWAWFTVNTRSVYYENEGDKKKLLALAPVLDMLNHSSMANTEMIIDYKEKVYTLKTLVEYKKFKEVFIKYGSHSNLTLLLEYGFITPDNPHDFVEFTYKEVLESIKKFDSDYGVLTKQKYNFIISNKLNENLTKNFDEYSWNLNALLHTFINRDDNIYELQRKIYSRDMTTSEEVKINAVKNILTLKKLNELIDCFELMKKLENSTKSFEMAKQLLSIYIKLLQSN